MITDKEYPATHSMSTAWYVADEEGNVAIINYNDNGPVPWETEETDIGELVFGHIEDYNTKEFLAIDLTDDQIDDLIENPHQPEDEIYWYDTIIQIDLGQEAVFLELAKNPDISIEFCISKERGLYLIDGTDCIKEAGNKVIVIKTSTLKKILDRGMIKRIYRAKDFFINDKWIDDEPYFEHRFSSAPYYIYGQSYNGDIFPAERLNIPVNPVKLSQFPPALRSRVPQVPIKFGECKKLQIAEWVPCCLYNQKGISINGYEYQLITLTNGSKAYVYTTLNSISFINYCSERTKYHCKECFHSCYTAYGQEFTDTPTVLFVSYPFSDSDDKMRVKSDCIIRHSVRVPLLHKIPYKHPQGYVMFKQDAKKKVKDHMLTNYFLKNYKHFEDAVLRINPQVIILEEKTKEILSQKYLIDKRHIEINDHRFPCYSCNEIEEKRENITKLALLPYRGMVMPYIISVEEMKQYKKKYNVSD